MKKKFYGALLLGSLFLAGGMVSCSDYDDDINSLTQRVDALEKTVAELQKAIEAGAVITNVQSTENGVTVTLSDGKTFEVKNGTNGTPGSVVAIDEEGYWCIDGKRQTDKEGNPIKAQGEKGDPGNPGNPGNPGSDGKDGCWYFPDKDGFWHKQYYNEEGEIVDEATDIAWTPSPEESVRVVYDPVNGCLQISNAEDMEEDQVIYIPITSNLKSLAAIPYVLDDATKYPMVFFYNIMGFEPNVEVGNVTADYGVASSTKAKAHFRLNPANADVKAWDWTMINRTVAVQVRAAGDAEDLLSIDSYERVNDELVVTLKSNKTLAGLENNKVVKEYAIAALQGTNKETSEVITSDYVKVTSKDLKKFSIINFAQYPAKTIAYAKAKNELDEANDIQMVYTNSVDLKEYVATWAEQVNDGYRPNVLLEQLLDEGEMSYEFKLPETYLGEDNITNQQDFIVLDNGVVSINKQKYPNGEAAIGRTPIVEVVAKVNGKTVAYACIRLSIVREAQTPQEPLIIYVSEEPVQVEYSSIEKDKAVQGFTWERMNREVYDVLKISREEFIETYIKDTEADVTPVYVDAEGNKVKGVTIKRSENGTESTSTNVLDLTFDETKVPSSVTGTATITYTPANTITNRPIQIVFKYVVSHNHVSYPNFNDRFVKDGIATVKGQMISGKWTQKVEISEHFLLDSYKADGNHANPVLEIDTEKLPEGTTYTLEGNTLKDQVLTLTSEIEGNELNIPVNVVIALDNKERICVKSYTIRFVNPLRLVVYDVNLEAVFPGKADEKDITFEVKDNEGNIIRKKDGTILSNAFGITALSEVDFMEGEDWSVFGWNNPDENNPEKTKKLTLDETKPSIKWENRGTALVSPVKTTYKVKVVVDGIAVMTESGNVTVTETDM